MDRPAVIEGCYVDLKFMPGIKCARVSIDIPIEHSNAFLKMFDAPDRANPVPVAVARLATSTAKQSTAPQGAATQNGPDYGALRDSARSTSTGGTVGKPLGHHAEAQGQDKPRTYSRSQIAAMKCADRIFQDWLLPRGERYTSEDGESWGDTMVRVTDAELKERLGISSKRELDTSPEKAEAFDRMLTDFDTRAYQR